MSTVSTTRIEIDEIGYYGTGEFDVTYEADEAISDLDRLIEDVMYEAKIIDIHRWKI